MNELKSNTEWKRWGKEDPMFGVSSWPGKEKDGPIPWTEEEFFALGRSDWHDFWRHWQQYGANTLSCLEVGCGAGRITRQLSDAFQHVYAVDVSEDMIRHAQKAVGSNVDFEVVDGIHLPQPDSFVTAIFSTHVLQHLDNVKIGYAYFREFHRVLDSGGTLMIHLPLYSFPPNRLRRVMRAVHRVAEVLSDTSVLLRRSVGAKTMRGVYYPLAALNAKLSGIGFKNVQFRIFSTRSNDDLHSFVFATK